MTPEEAITVTVAEIRPPDHSGLALEFKSLGALPIEAFGGVTEP